MHGDVIGRRHEKPISVPGMMGLLEAVKSCIMIGPEAHVRTYACGQKLTAYRKFRRGRKT